MADGVSNERFAEMERAVAELNTRLVSLNEWCLDQVAVRDSKIERLERTNAIAHAELARLRMIISSVGVIAQQAHPPPAPDPDEERGT